MLFSELYKIMVNKITFAAFREIAPPLEIAPSAFREIAPL